ncbi:MAG: phosphoglucosamine mutase [Bacilli bacterium]|nr:phosphoglucosamine mutase [Bacilli bacterium]
MTLGEKIAHLRIVNDISQEQLSKLLNVSRQSVSKWESDESLPQIDKVLELSELFKITTDELLNPNIVIHRGKKLPMSIGEDIKTKYFGTDGFRGEVNIVLTADHAYKIGRFLGWFYSNPKYTLQKPGYRARVVIGKDTRRSSYMLEYAVAAGLAASGADVDLLHVTTTPSVSYIVRQDCFDCGVMITASHNPFYDNGIKVINCNGEKLEDAVAVLIEAYLDGDLKKLEIEGNDLPFATKENIGCISDYSSGRNRYVGYLISLAKHSMKSLRIGLDTSNGASWMIAKNVFDALGAQTFVINNDPNGLNINLNAGSTHIENLCKFVKDNKLDLGFAFDGDCDRCIAVDENGHEVDGDKIMYLLACKLKAEGALEKSTLVTTIMSNSGLTKALKQIGVKNVQTKVGDRFVFERMQNDGYSLGGEQSGHVIIKKYATTGDGILTAVMVTEEILSKKEKLSKLVAPVHLLPQKMKNVRVTNKAAVVDDEMVQAKFKEVNEEIGDNGRALLRQSGTEPVVRIMVECPTVAECDAYIEKIYNVIKKRGYVCE